MINTSTCFAILAIMDMPFHIVRHSVQVSRVAALVASHMNEAFNEADVREIETAGLIHDVTKPRSFYTGENHAVTGGTLLLEMGYRGLSEIVRQHVVLDTYDTGKMNLKAAIVNYADRRVMHDKVVHLDERMEYSIENYGDTPEKIRGIRIIWDKSRELETYLFRNLPFSPDDLAGMDLFYDFASVNSAYEASLRRLESVKQ